MNYQPKPGDYGIISTNGYIGFLIRLGTFSRWNHAFVYIGEINGFGGGWIVEATTKGVVLSHISKYDGIPIAWNNHEAWGTHSHLSEDEERKIIITEALKYVGYPYDFRDIIVLGFRCLGLKMPRLFTSKLLANPKRLICSELIAILYKLAFRGEIVAKLVNLVTPCDLGWRLMYQ